MSQHVLRKIISVLTVLFYAQVSTAAQTAQQIEKPHSKIISSATIDQTVSPIVERLMVEKNIPGVSVIVVKDGGVIFKKGYGFADQDNKIPVNPDTSVFHIGSVTKLFTATAAMQLHEQGKLDLHKSVNAYLKAFKVEEPFGKPITMTNLLTHTGGLHYKLLGTVTPFGQVSTPLAEHLKKALPGPARTPGFVSVYSDYGIALAGHVIEEISGMSYQEYVDKHILQPLGMTNSGLILTPERSLQMAMPGAADPTNFPPADFNYSNFAPATEIHSTVGDMAKFMLMQLGYKDGTNEQILKPETRKLMQTRQFSPHPSAFGWGYAFRENVYNGHPAIGHSGSWFKHLGRMALLPQFDLGIYIVMNKRHSAIYKDVTQAIVEMVAPAKPIRKPTGKEAPISAPLSQYAGTYIMDQLSTTTIERLGMISDPHALYEVRVDGNALISGTDYYYEVEEGYFLRTDGTKNMTFVKDPNTQEVYLVFNGGGGKRRATFYEQPATQAVLILTAFACLIFGVVWQKRDNKPTSNVQLYKVNVTILGLALAFVPFVIGVLLMGQELGLHITTPWWVSLLFKTPWVIIILLATSLGTTIKHFRDTNKGPQALNLVGTACYLAALTNWNLL